MRENTLKCRVKTFFCNSCAQLEKINIPVGLKRSSNACNVLLYIFFSPLFFPNWKRQFSLKRREHTVLVRPN